MPDDTWSTVRSLGSVARAGLRLERPDRLPRALLTLATVGPTLAGTVAASAARYPLAAAVIDEAGALGYRDLWKASCELARELRHRRLGEGTTVGLLARNGRTFAVGMIAAAVAGADVVYLNTGFAAPQLADVVAAEGIDALLHDDEFAAAVAGCGARVTIGAAEISQVCSRRSSARFTPSRHLGRQVILTSGTTGRPKGAARGAGRRAAVGSLAAIVGTVPVRARDTVVIAAPWFHAWGLGNLSVALSLSCTVVTEQRFVAEATLAAIARHRADGLVVVPPMLRRLVDAGSPATAEETSSLRYVASSGAALGAPLVRAVLATFGPKLYNVYGSTEVSLATIATPEDLAVEPTTAGRPAAGSTVRIVDRAGRDVAPGEVGRVFVANPGRFDGYTGGGSKEALDGLLATGDLGHLDAAGRLHIDGREDDMIVSGGENVYPGEVEDLLAAHPGVAEVAVVGVPDEEFGERLRAVVVRARGSRVTGETLRRHVGETLARHKVPREVRFVEELPHTTTGKVIRNELRR